MTIRNLHPLLAPTSVALIGASEQANRLGTVVLSNLLQGRFKGPIWPVNPHRRTVQGLPAWPDVQSLPAAPDLAVICTPPATVVPLVQALGARGTRAAVVMTAGLKQADRAGSGRSLEQAMLEAARPYLLRVLGPNCLGLLVPAIGLNASFAPSQALPGRLAFLSQSGALATAMLDWANQEGIGFSHFISLGDSADVDFGDLLDYLSTEASTQALLLYMESVTQARKFMSAARAAARNKPVIVVKAGRAPEGARAAASHTGALAGSDQVFEAAAARAGLLRVDTLEALFDAAQTLAHWDRALTAPYLSARRRRLAIVTNGGGAGVLAADALALSGGRLAQLSPQSLAALDAFLPATWSHGNPVDLIGDAPIERYTRALEVLCHADEVDGLLFMHAPTAVVPAADIAAACIPVLQATGKPVLGCWLGGPSVAQARRLFQTAGLVSHDTPERSIAAWQQLCDDAAHQEMLQQLPASGPVEEGVSPQAGRDRVLFAQQEGRLWLGDADSMALMTSFGLPGLQTLACRSLEEAVDAAQVMGYPVALKVISPQVLHKSDAGGVVLHLGQPDELRQAAARIAQDLRHHCSDAVLLGYTVQKMAQGTGATRELIMGLKTDPVFGPVLLLGQGGTEVELQGRFALALPPLNQTLAEDLIERSGIEPLLAAHRGRPAAHRPALVAALLKLSQLAAALPEVAELDINPLWIDDRGVQVIDARVRLRRPDEPAVPPAILPYPAELQETWTLEGRALQLRPIRPEDGRALQQFYARATAEDLRLRFFAARREVPLSELARYSQIDYDREMTFVLVSKQPEPALIAQVRAVCDPDRQSAEFALQVATAEQGRGLGERLLRKLIDYLRTRGVGLLQGSCLLENGPMLDLVKRLGFTVTTAGEEGLARFSLELGQASQTPPSADSAPSVGGLRQTETV